MLLLLTGVPASGQTDSLVFSLDSIAVFAPKTTSSLKGRISDHVTWDLTRPSGAPKVLGTADPIRLVNMLPGIQTASEFDGGIHILGTDASHNEISLNGVPVYGANHLFGLFSVFIPSHFKTMEYSPDSNGSERLGGMVNMLLPDDIPAKTGGEFSIGLLSAQGTLRLPVGEKSAVHVSARRSFLNTFYHRRMVMDGGTIGYGFTDLNFTWVYKPDQNNTLWLDGFSGSDNASLLEPSMGANIEAGWGSKMGSVKWKHNGERSSMEHSAYISRYANNTLLDHELLHIRMPSSITTCGYSFELDLNRLGLGLDARYHEVLPQYPQTGANVSISRQQALELVPYLVYAGEINDDISYQAGFRSLLYLSPENDVRFLPEPFATVRKAMSSGSELSFKFSLKHQNICKAGFTQTALPIEFYYLTGSTFSAPQSALNFRLSYDRSLLDGLLSFSASAYFTALDNQVEYTGFVYDLLSLSYSVSDMIHIGEGKNYGLFLMLSKRSGRFTGWAGYAFGRALRTIEGPDGVEKYPASHDRPHEFNLVCNYKAGKFDFGTSFVAASGTPFTAPDYFYLCSGRIMSHYHSHNANRLEPYVRMDMSADYLILDKGGSELGVNFSVNNVLCRKNAMYYSLHVEEDGHCYRKRTFLNISMMPSASLFLKF